MLNIVLRKYQLFINIYFSLGWLEEAAYFKGEVIRLHSCYFLEIFIEHNHVLSIVLGTGDRVVNKTYKNHALMELTYCGRDR